MTNQQATPPRAHALAVIEREIKSADVQKRLIVALDLKPDDEEGQREAFKYASSVMAEIAKSQGSGNYTDLTKATPESICMAMIDAAQFKLQIDGRKLCHIEMRDGKATLQIDTNGFVAKIQERNPDFSFSIIKKFKGDTLTIKGSEGAKTYFYESKNPFGNLADLDGIGVHIQYTNQGGAKVQDFHTVSIEELRTIASKSKGPAFKDFGLERMSTAALKRACKWHFRKDSLLQKMVDFDNRNFDVSTPQPAAEVRPSIVDNINQSLKAKPADAESTPPPAGQVIDAEDEDIVEEPDAEALLREQGTKAANEGRADYIAWKDALSAEQKAIVKPMHRDFLKIIADNEEAAAAQDAPKATGGEDDSI